MRILFFGLDYHTYTRNIIAEMEALGASVTYVDIQPRNSFYKILRTTARSVYEKYTEIHHAAAIHASEGVVYDKVVFLQAHQISLDNLAWLRDVQSRAEFTLYNWDAITNHDYRPQAPLFDRVLTFDRHDAATHGYEYLPLFCQRSMQGLRRDRVQSGTIYMVGNLVRPERYTAIQAFRNYCKKMDLKFREHVKVTPVVWANLIKTGMRPSCVRLRAIKHQDFRDLIETSVAAFDFANHAQSGQTMRMMESLCTGKKIITNNSWVKVEPYYSTDRIHVFHGLDFDGVIDFLNIPIERPDETFAEYNIQSFVQRLLNMDQVV